MIDHFCNYEVIRKCNIKMNFKRYDENMERGGEGGGEVDIDCL